MEKKYSVKETCELCNLSRIQLRYYEDQGLLQNVYRDTNNYRLYTKEQILLLNYIKEFRALGFSSNDLLSLIRNDEVPNLRNFAKKGIAEAKKEFDKSVSVFENKVMGFSKILEATYILENRYGGPDSKIEIVEIPAKNVIAYDYAGNFLDEPIAFYKSFNILNIELEKYGLTKTSNRMYEFVDHYNVETGEFSGRDNKIKLFYEIKETSSKSPLQQKIQGFRALTFLHVGDFGGNLIATYKQLFQWAKAHNITLTNTSYEDTLLDMDVTLNTQNWITKVFLKIQE